VRNTETLLKCFSLLLAISLFCPAACAVDVAHIDQYVEARLADHRVAGASLVLVQDGKLIHSRSFGHARSDVAMTADTPLVIGSLSKAFTATAVLQLVDQGKIDLDAPIQRYLPEFKLADANAAAKVSVRHLLNQTSGLPATAPRAPQPATLNQHVAALRNTSLEAEPGQRHVYSSPNYQVLGLLVERVSKMSFADYVTAHIFTPLRMTHSHTDAARAAGDGLADGHNYWFGLTFPSAYAHEPDRLPTASIISTAADLGRFAAAHLGDGTPILSADGLKSAHAGAGLTGGSFKYAMGWRAGKTAGIESLWHGGALPSYRGAMVLIPERKLGIVLLTNSSSMFADHTREIATGVVSLLDDKPPQDTARPLGLIYAVIAAVAFVLLVLNVRSLVLAVRGHRKPTPLWSVLSFNIVLPIVLIAMLPRWTHVPFTAMYDGTPDIVVTIVVLVCLSMFTGLAKLRRRPVGAELA
jgi:CubicO group peptidase (beta-lactamase class C family)